MSNDPQYPPVGDDQPPTTATVIYREGAPAPMADTGPSFDLIAAALIGVFLVSLGFSLLVGRFVRGRR